MKAVRSLVLVLFALVASLAMAGERVQWRLGAPVDAAPGSTVTVTIVGVVDPEWHIYSTVNQDGPIETSFEPVAPLTFAGEVRAPAPKRKFDEGFEKELDYYDGTVEFEIPVVVPEEGGAIAVTYQACSGTLCLPPQTTQIGLDGSVRDIDPFAEGAGGTDPPAADFGAGVPPEAFQTVAGQVEDTRQRGLIAFVTLAFGLGLLTLLTPCVFPMIPITVSYFSKQKGEGTGRTGLIHALAYCFGIIGSFTAFGILVTVFFGATGIQQFATNPWINLGLAALFIFLALNLFGAITVTLPASVTNQFSPYGKAGLIAPLMMGFAFTLTSFTCTVPFVGAVLVAATTGDLLYPIVGMLAFSSAFAIPFFLLALFPGYMARLPKAGSWMDTMKGFMGFLELAAAVKFLSNADLVWNANPLLPRAVFLTLWVVIFVFAAFFLLGWIRLPKVSIPPKLGVGRAVVAALTLVGTFYLLAGINGRSLGEMEAFLPPGKTEWILDYDEGLRIAQAERRPMIINFTGVTCTNCRWMEKNMFPRPEVERELNRYVKVELFTDRQTPGDARNRRLQRELTGTVALPVYLIVQPDGKTVVRMFEGSTRDPQQFVAFLQPGSAPPAGPATASR
jgi:thiol:disulfide interchange protein